ncbi:MAG TPA: TlpA disulfide reductase family protein [Terracidiphilus sp.]|nr:TlpA disulfide reductase family protein [Terracidiphilus sp.]
MRMIRVLVLLGCAITFMPRGGMTQPTSNLVERPAPQFVRGDLDGRQIDLKEFRGKVVLLNFWATWCAPCQIELPRFESWQKRYGAKGLQVVAVSMDDGEAPVRRTVRRLHLAFPVVMGDAKLGEAYGGVLGLPITFLIDRNGVVVTKLKGETDLEQLESRVKALVAR